MSNTPLTPNMILRETYAIAHQVSNFIMRTNRQYDDRFAGTGVKIGQNLDIRLPAKYVTRTGNAMQVQNYVERKVPLPLATIKGVDLNFGQEELTFSIQDFSTRVLRPAVSQLIADVEADAFSMIQSVPNYVGIVSTTTGSGLNYLQFQTCGKYLADNLAPRGMDRTATLNSESTVTFNDAVKGLFQSSEAIEQQYVEGVMGRTGGFNVYENTLLPAHTTGLITTTGAALTVTTTSGAPGFFDGTGNAWPDATFLTINLDGGDTATQFRKGDIVTFSNTYEVHPETKQNLGYLKRFVVDEDVDGTSTVALKIKPVPIVGGAYANVNSGIADGETVSRVGQAVGTGTALTYAQNLFFHRDAFAFVTADLEDPSQYGAWGGRQVMDGLSIRIWRQGDIANGAFPCRLDIAYGYTPVYPEWACRQIHRQGLIQ